MSTETENLLLAEIRQLRADVKALAHTGPAFRSAEETKPLSVPEFAKIIRRKPRFVSDRCRTGKIKTLPGKPYRIHPAEVRRWVQI